VALSLCGGKSLASQSCLGQALAHGGNCLHLNAENQPLFIDQFPAKPKYLQAAGGFLNRTPLTSQSFQKHSLEGGWIWNVGRSQQCYQSGIFV